MENYGELWGQATSKSLSSTLINLGNETLEVPLAPLLVSP
jgi:hypothetical protein